MLKATTLAAIAMFATAGIAHAVTISNTGEKPFTVGIG